MTMKTTLFVPVLNEAEGLKLIMPRIKPGWFDQILVVDGNSPDGSAAIAQAMGFDVYIQKNPGIRNAYIEAWNLIRGDAVITFSPDGNAVPEDVPLLIEKMREGYDMVIASRYLNGARSEDDDLVTAFGNRLFTNSINLLYGSRYTDAMTIFRAYRTSLFYELDLDKEETYRRYERIFRTRIGIEPVLSIRAAKRKCACTDILSIEKKRVAGERKLQIFKWGAAYFLQMLCERCAWQKRASP